jgi:hypothetical protein
MNIGTRIVERLNELGWQRKDLLEALPELTPQALSALITRGSKRSELDEYIASGLGVSVMWLVYGHKDDDDKSGNVSRLNPINPLVKELVEVAESISDRGIAELIGRAKEVSLQHPRDNHRKEKRQ